VSEPNDSRADKRRSDALFNVLALALAGVAVATVYYLTRNSRRFAELKSIKASEVRSYVVGYGMALVLTCAAFAMVRWQLLSATRTLTIVLVLALLQMVVHFRFFLHISLRKSARDDLQLILFSALIVILMVSGTLVILFNLRARMM
jgi:cytochrome o ubiquinol oxidase operon protein cyoD